MKKEERLFIAFSGVDEELLERSEKTAKHTGRWIAWGAALAACLAVVLAVHAALPKAPEVPPPYLVDDLPANPPPAQPGPSHTPAQPSLPAAPEKLRCLQAAIPERNIPEFFLWLNEEIYYAHEQNGVYTIRPYDPPQVPDEVLPECKMEIEYMEGGLADAAEAVRARLEGLYESVSEIDRESGWDQIGWPPLPQYYFRADNGIAWNSAQREVWLIPCEEGGVFILSSSYFLEAEEGHGVRFETMVYNFHTRRETDFPAWTESLEDAVQRLTKAVLGNDLSGVEDLLTPDTELLSGGEDVYAYVSVAGVYYDYDVLGPYQENPDSTPVSAGVSVKYRLGGEDSYEFLTMQLRYEDGWLLEWAGIEK